MNKISVFANFYINDHERFLRMKNSFLSFYKANIGNWVINVRGSYSKKTILFLKQKLKKNYYFFNIDSGDWFDDSRNISKYLKSKYVFFWTEDHICVGGYKKFNNIVSEINENNIDYLGYSWFFNGLTLDSFKNFSFNNKKNIIYLKYTHEILKKRLKWFRANNAKIDYIIVQQSIMKIKLFKKLLIPPFFSFLKKNIPHAFEKNFRFTNWLPYKLGILKNELFACIDDDNFVKNSSLISRKMYPDRLSKLEKLNIKKNRANSSAKYNFLGRIYYSSYLNKIKSFFKQYFNI